MPARIHPGVLSLALLSLATPAGAQTVWYVDDDGDPSNGCTSWPDACPDLQTALSLAQCEGEVWVAEGVYTPTESGGDRSAAFEPLNGVAIYGGFDGTESSLGERSGLFEGTILSGDLNANDIPSDFPGGSSYSENSYHVVRIPGITDATAILDGFTITSGNADEPGFPGDRGGGVRSSHSGSATIANCILIRNSARFGGGMYNNGGAHVIMNCAFIENVSTTFQGGGMVNVFDADATLINCVFLGNVATHPTATSSAGGMYIHESSPLLVNCVFSGNSADYGGGMMVQNGGNPSLVNCTFSGNTATIRGGGVYNLGKGSTPIFSNCILWGNSDGGPQDESAQIEDTKGSTSTITYGCIQDDDPDDASIPFGGKVNHNIDDDPLFVDADGPDDTVGTEDDDLYLIVGSPVIDAGDNTALTCAIIDLARNPRRLDDPAEPDGGNGDAPIVDMGAYEFVPSDCNDNGIPDSEDIAEGTSTDANDNSIPDECERETNDCNGSGLNDACDILIGTGQDCNDNKIPDACDIAGGQSIDDDGNGVPDECECSADFDGDGDVDAADLADLLAAWGPNTCHPADINGDHQVDSFDLGLLLSAWGPCG